MLNLDPPTATRLRRLVSREFTPTAVARWTQRIRAISEQLFEELAAANVDGSADLTRQFASPLPTMVIAELLGVPTADRENFKRWSDELLGATFLNHELAGKAKQANLLLQEYFHAMITEKEKNPTDDLIGLYIRTTQSEEDALTRDEIISHCMLLLVGGNETTANLIGNAILAFDQFPAALRRLYEDRALIPQAIEEALRYDSPTLGIRRATTRDVVVAGTTIPKDSMVMLMLAAANRDQRQYDDPDRFDVDRNPRDHLAFGGGPHLCIGAPLARLEASVALDTLLSRTQHLRVSAEPELQPNIYLRGRSSIPIAFTPN